MKAKGFTLLELMIVVAIVSILATIAIPAYQDYVKRARVVEGFNMASAAQLAVNETTVIDGALPANQAATGYISPVATSNVSSITIGNLGVITITFTAAAGGGTVILQPTLDPGKTVTWSCSGGTLPAQFRPTSCRP